jgi:hypothetical protein
MVYFHTQQEKTVCEEKTSAMMHNYQDTKCGIIQQSDKTPSPYNCKKTLLIRGEKL